MSAQPVLRPSQDPSSTVHALTGFAAAVVIAGGALAWALLTTPAAAIMQVAAGGTIAAVVVVATATAAVYYASSANQNRRAAAASERRARRLEDEFTWLSDALLPVMTRRARNGASPGEIFEGIQRPESDAVRTLLTTVQRAMSDVMTDAAAIQAEVQEAAKSVQQDAAAASDRATAADARLAAIEAEAVRLHQDAVPAVMERLHAGEQRDEVLSDTSQTASPALAVLFETVVTELAAAERRAASAMAACANAAARIQAQTTRMLADLRDMEHQYGDDKVFADLMALDHLVSQMGRLADSIALLSGGRTGRRWTRPIPVESVLRGAMSRIDAYQRVRVHSTSTSAIAGYAAEGVIHALAELMDNATAFSAHGAAVHVYVEEEDAGLVVTIEDSGLGMRTRERERAGQAVSQPLDLATLPGTRLGLAVVGRVADRYGLTVSFRPSSRGGTGVVMMIPRPLISHTKNAADASPELAPASSGGADAQATRDTGAPQPAPVDHESDTESTKDTGTFNLPVRPRGRTLADAPQSPLNTRMAGGQPDAGSSSDSGSSWDSRPGDSGSRFAAFRTAANRVIDGSSGSGEYPVTSPGAGTPAAGAPDAGSDQEGLEGTE